MKNPFAWVEIYVSDMARAQKFYETVLNISMLPMETPGGFGDLEMLCFPWEEGGKNISGALCKMKDMSPGNGGTLVYFGCDDSSSLRTYRGCRRRCRSRVDSSSRYR